tara:strand:+ start:225 stop:2618 length:2394 start_codon:yes stop_codon:yes gene_type:complete
MSGESKTSQEDMAKELERIRNMLRLFGHSGRRQRRQPTPITPFQRSPTQEELDRGIRRDQERARQASEDAERRARQAQQDALQRAADAERRAESAERFAMQAQETADRCDRISRAQTADTDEQLQRLSTENTRLKENLQAADRDNTLLATELQEAKSQGADLEVKLDAKQRELDSLKTLAEQAEDKLKNSKQSYMDVVEMAQKQDTRCKELEQQFAEEKLKYEQLFNDYTSDTAQLVAEKDIAQDQLIAAKKARDNAEKQRDEAIAKGGLDQKETVRLCKERTRMEREDHRANLQRMNESWKDRMDDALAAQQAASTAAVRAEQANSAAAVQEEKVKAAAAVEAEKANSDAKVKAEQEKAYAAEGNFLKKQKGFKNEIEKLKKNITTLRNEKSQSDSTIEALRAENVRKDAEIQRLNEKEGARKEDQQEIDQLKAEISSLNAQIKAAQSKADERVREKEKLQKQINELRAETARKDGRITDLNKQIKDLKAKQSNMTPEEVAAAAKLAQSQSIRNEQTDLSRRINILNGKFNTLAGEKTQLQREVTDLTRERDTARQNCDDRVRRAEQRKDDQCRVKLSTQRREDQTECENEKRQLREECDNEKRQLQRQLEQQFQAQMASAASASAAASAASAPAPPAPPAPTPSPSAGASKMGEYDAARTKFLQELPQVIQWWLIRPNINPKSWGPATRMGFKLQIENGFRLMGYPDKLPMNVNIFEVLTDYATKALGWLGTQAQLCGVSYSVTTMGGDIVTSRKRIGLLLSAFVDEGVLDQSFLQTVTIIPNRDFSQYTIPLRF